MNFSEPNKKISKLVDFCVEKLNVLLHGRGTSI